MKPQLTPYPGRCPVCRLPLRPVGEPPVLLYVDLDRPDGDPHRTVHAACRQTAATRRTA